MNRGARLLQPEPRPTGATCANCGADTQTRRPDIGGIVVVCGVCLYELPH